MICDGCGVCLAYMKTVLFSHLDKWDSCVIAVVAVHNLHLIHLLLQSVHPGVDVLVLPPHLLHFHPHLLSQLCCLQSFFLLLLLPLQFSYSGVEGLQFGVDVSHLGFGLVHVLLQTLAQLEEAMSHHVHVVPGGMFALALERETGCYVHQNGHQEDEKLWHLHLCVFSVCSV